MDLSTAVGADTLIAQVQDNAEQEQPIVMQGPPEWLTHPDESARCFVFLIALSAVLPDTAQNALQPLRTLDGLRRDDVRDAVLDALSNPVIQHSGGRPRDAIQPLKLVVFLEVPCHFHVA